MKKIITLILAFSMLLALAATFCSCSEEEEAPAVKRVKLTSENFKDYFAVNTTYDYQMVHLCRDTSGRDYYDIFCTVTITTAPSGNYTYENVTAEYGDSFPLDDGWIDPDPLYRVTSVNIGADGYSEATYVKFKEDVYYFSDSTFATTQMNNRVSLKNVTGTVIIPAE